jgi:hypothetical protein
MAIEVEIHPLFAGTALREAEHVTVEMPRGRKVINRDSEVERRKAHRRVLGSELSKPIVEIKYV